MTTYGGKIKANPGYSDYYQTSARGCNKYYLCAGCAYEILGRGSHDSCRDSISWGYDGSGPELLSAALIGCAIDGPGAFNELQFSDLAIQLVRRHYRAFTEEFVVHFEDAWSISGEQILAWVRNKEKELEKANGMIKFTGRIIRKPNKPDHYDVRLHGPLYLPSGVGMCGGIASKLCGNGSSPETMAWGYDGKGANHLSALLLAYSHSFELGAFSYYKWSEGGPIAIKHHAAFTSEIVKHFGDTWEITADDVQAWVKEKEKEEFKLNAAT